MLASKASLIKTVRTLLPFDPAGSPFIGLQWGEGTPLFHRSGSTGYIETVGWRPEPPAAIVSLTHLRDTLANMQDDELDLMLDRNGILTLRGEGGGYTTELRVHTVRSSMTWAKVHNCGKQTVTVDPSGFKGIKTGSFTLAAPPVLRRNKLMLATNHGIIMRDQVPVTAYPYPRESFLQAITNLKTEQVYLTEEGYWGAVAEGFNVMISGHRAGDQLFDSYSIGSSPLAEFSAARLTHVLGAAGNMAAEGSRITLDPNAGVLVRDQFGQENKFSFGESCGWSTFAILPRTAKVLADAFNQAKEVETISLSQMDATTMRMTRGLWEVSFKFFPIESTKGNRTA